MPQKGYIPPFSVGAKIGVSGRMVRKHVAVLREAGLLVREGGAKGGHWKVTK